MLSLYCNLICNVFNLHGTMVTCKNSACCYHWGGAPVVAILWTVRKVSIFLVGFNRRCGTSHADFYFYFGSKMKSCDTTTVFLPVLHTASSASALLTILQETTSWKPNTATTGLCDLRPSRFFFLLRPLQHQQQKHHRHRHQQQQQRQQQQQQQQKIRSIQICSWADITTPNRSFRLKKKKKL